MTQHVYVVLPGIQYELNGSLSIDRIEVRAKINGNYTQLYNCYEQEGEEVSYPTFDPVIDDIPYLVYNKITDIDTLSTSDYNPVKFVYTSKQPIRRAKDYYFFLNSLEDKDGVNYQCISVYNTNLDYYNNITNTDGLCYVPVANSSDVIIFEIKLFSQVRYTQNNENYDENYVFIDTVLFKYSPLINIPINHLTFNDEYKDMYYEVSKKDTLNYYDIKLNDNVIVYKQTGDKKYLMKYVSGKYVQTNVELDLLKTLLWVHPLFGFNGDCTHYTKNGKFNTQYKGGNKALIFMPWMPTIKCSTQPVRYPPFYFYNTSGAIYEESKNTILHEKEGGDTYVAKPEEMTIAEYALYATRSRSYAWDGGLQQRLAINMACASPILREQWPNTYNLLLDKVVATSEKYDSLYDDYEGTDLSIVDKRLERLEFWLGGAFALLKRMGIYYNNLLRPSHIATTDISYCFKLDGSTDKYNFNNCSNFLNINEGTYSYRWLNNLGEDEVYLSTFPLGASDKFEGWPGGISLSDRGIWPVGRNNWTTYEGGKGHEGYPLNYTEYRFKPISTKLVNSVLSRRIDYNYAGDNTITPKYLALYDNKNPKITLTNQSDIDPIGIKSINGSVITTKLLSTNTFIKKGGSKVLDIQDKSYVMEANEPGGVYVLPECWLAVNYNTSDLLYNNKSDYKIRPKISLTLGDTILGVYLGNLVPANVVEENYFVDDLPWGKNTNNVSIQLYYDTINNYYLLSSSTKPDQVNSIEYLVLLDPGLYVLSINLYAYITYYNLYSQYYDFCSLNVGNSTYKHRKGDTEVLVAFYIKQLATISITLSELFLYYGVYGNAFTTGVGIHLVDYKNNNLDSLYNQAIKRIISELTDDIIFEQDHEIYQHIVFQGILSYKQANAYNFVEIPESHLKIVAAYKFDNSGNIVYDSVKNKSCAAAHVLSEEDATDILNIAEPKILS